MTDGRTEAPSKRPGARIVVVGVGGAGVNAVRRVEDAGIAHARLVAVDTSAQTLARASGMECMLLRRLTRGLGAGGDAALGAAACRIEEEEVVRRVAGADVAFIVAGLAGGTGGGAAPVIASLAREGGALVLGLGIEPFAFEGARRRRQAAEARRALRAASHTLVALENRRALEVAGGAVGLDVALRVADDVVRQAVRGLHDMLYGRGWIDVDLPAVVRRVSKGGEAALAVGTGRGDQPALAAMRAAIASPLCDPAIVHRCRSVLVHVSGDDRLAVADVDAAVGALRRVVRRSCDLHVGASVDPLLAGAAQVTLIAMTGEEAAGAAAVGEAAAQLPGRRGAAAAPPPARVASRPAARAARSHGDADARGAVHRRSAVAEEGSEPEPVERMAV